MKDDFQLVNALRTVVEVEDEASVAISLVHLFTHNKNESPLLRNFIRKEVQNAGNNEKENEKGKRRRRGKESTELNLTLILLTTDHFGDVFKSSNTLASKVTIG